MMGVVFLWTSTKKKAFLPPKLSLTKLHAGGKYDSNSYKVSGGLHGVGVSCNVNALSEKLDLEIWREGFTWQQEYARGIPLKPLERAGKAGRKTGTKITFRPDPTIMEAMDFSYDTLAQRLRELAFLNKGPEDHTNRRTRRAGKKHRVYLQRRHRRVHQTRLPLNRGKGVLPRQPDLRGRRKAWPERNGQIEIALQYNDGYAETLFSFANNINTVDGGTHLRGFRTALTRTINAFWSAIRALQGCQREFDRRRCSRGPHRGD